MFCSLPTELEPHCDFNDRARSSMVLTEQREELETARQDVKDRAKDRAMEAMEGREEGWVPPPRFPVWQSSSSGGHN